jgi:hypothetical protein
MAVECPEWERSLLERLFTRDGDFPPQMRLSLKFPDKIIHHSTIRGRVELGSVRQFRNQTMTRLPGPWSEHRDPCAITISTVYRLPSFRFLPFLSLFSAISRSSCLLFFLKGPRLKSATLTGRLDSRSQWRLRETVPGPGTKLPPSSNRHHGHPFRAAVRSSRTQLPASGQSDNEAFQA